MARDVDGLRLTVAPKWASAGTALADTPENEGLTRSVGWPISYATVAGDLPTIESFNGLFRELFGALIDLAEHGVLEWAATQPYSHPALVTYGSNLYISLRDTTGDQPDTATDDWALVPITGSQIASAIDTFLGATTWRTGGGPVGNLAASAITSGVFDVARIPNLPASKITSGSFASSRIPSLSASKITSGILDAARIPGLDAAKLVSGILAAARIPNLNASKINAGTLASSRIPTISVSKGGTGATSAAQARQNLGITTLGNSFNRYTSSGAWTKPSGVTWVYVEVIGAGGSGGSTDFGLPGLYASTLYRASDLGASVVVTVGDGGDGQSTFGGELGGSSSFGDFGSVGGQTHAGNTTSAGVVHSLNPGAGSWGASSGQGGIPGRGNVTITPANQDGEDSLAGTGSGGGLNGGDGGDPGGGGGRRNTAANGGDGGRGEVRVWAW